ncbi:D-alanyl-D-alanine carboxypeptidase family protein [Bacillus marinisedimentorum]|uniref:D-alanyl-D-alanine carboxypeptidase family protein n=1 Tax=Bacillus marinisedimentorum TaxID=1821260 RepID=UPI0008726D10|nr:D-alanyl-D-alanine carboxypeptidase family protein [Bacillus marinisedimentorum]
MKRVLFSLVSILVILTALLPAAVSAEENKSLDLADNAESAVLMERDSGKIMFEKNADKELPPASMTKIMTMLLVMEAMENGELKMDETVRTSDYAASMGGSQIFLEPGEEMTVRDLLKGVAIASGNDASVALAERVAGSEDAFVEQMNKRAKELGLKNSAFKNVTGLPAEGHYSSANDMAVIAKELLKYDKVIEFTGTYEDYLREDTDKKFWLVNTNRLVKFYPGVDGLKTGYTNEAKYCLTATAKRDGMRVIAVVMGAPTPKERNRQVSKMLDYAFNRYETHQLYEQGKKIGEVPIIKGDRRYADLVTAEPISLLTKKGEKTDDIKTEVKVPQGLQAPLEKGSKAGKLIFTKNGEVVLEKDLVVKEEIKTASWLDLFKRNMSWFGGQK